MTRVSVFPYLRPAYGSVRLAGFSVEWPATTQLEDQLILEGWDPGIPIQTLATIELDSVAVLNSTELSGTDLVRCAITWQCPQTTLRGAGSPEDLELGSKPEHLKIELSATIPGSSVAGWIDLRVQLILAREGIGLSPLAARRPGSVLWVADRRVVLQGTGSRFPVDSVDFTTYPSLPNGAGWHLEWDRDDLTAPVHGQLRLLINSKNSTVRGAAAAPEGAPEHRAITSMMQYTIAYALITGALSNQEFLDAPDQYAEGSVGAAVRRLMRVAFPQRTPMEIATILKTWPDRFDSELQAGLRVFGAEG